MAFQQSKVECRFADGSSISAFMELTLSERFLEPIDSCRMTLGPLRDRGLLKTYLDKTRKGELVTVLIDGNVQGGFMIQMQRLAYGGDGCKIEISALSPLKLLQEATADDKLTKDVAADSPVSDLVLKSIEPFGIFKAVAGDDTLVIRSKSGKAPGSKKTDVQALKYQEAKVQPNESVYGFLSRIVTRLGVIIRMDAETGTIILTKPHYDGKVMGTVVLDGAQSPVGDRAWGDWEIVDTNEMQFDFCEVKGSAPDKPGETRSNVPKARVTSSELNADRPPFRAGEVIKYKPLFILDTESRDKVRSKSTAFLALGTKSETAFYVRCKVQGLVSREGTPWTVNTIVHVYSELYGLDDDMWLSERTMHVDAGGGQWTELVLVPKGYVRLGES